MTDSAVIRAFGGSLMRCAEYFDAMPAAIYRSTIEGKIIYCNQAFAQIFGYESPAELMGIPAVELYRNKKDRGAFVSSILQRGRLVDVPIAFKKKDGTAVWCAITAKVVLDDEDTAIHLDGFLRPITAEIDVSHAGKSLDVSFDSMLDAVVIIDLLGQVVDANAVGCQLLGVSKERLLGEPLARFFISNDSDIFLIFLSDIIKIGRNEIVLSIKDSESRLRHLECHAYLVKSDGKPKHIKCLIREVTEFINQQRQRSSDEKFQGVLEMAGSVAHSLNQPLTIVNNLLNEVLADLQEEDRMHSKIKKVHVQIAKINELTKKISNIKKYEAMDYVAGVKIVDIEKSSREHNPEGGQ